MQSFLHIHIENLKGWEGRVDLAAVFRIEVARFVFLGRLLLLVIPAGCHLRNRFLLAMFYDEGMLCLFKSRGGGMDELSSPRVSYLAVFGGVSQQGSGLSAKHSN